MILNLILASIQSILQVIVIVVFGFILTKAGYFTNEKQKWLSKLNMVFFTPCLLFSNIASVISFEKLLAYWPIPVFFMLFVSLSYITAQLVSRIVRLNESYRRFVLACTMFSNTNSLPIAVITSLAVSEGGKVLYWGADDTQSDVAARGISYTLFFAIFGNILRWSYGYSLLQNYGKGPGSDQGTLVVEYGATNQTDEDISTHRSSSPSSSSLSNRSLLDVEEGQISRRDSTTTIAGEHRKPVNETTSLLSSFPILPSDVDGDGLKERPAWVQKIMDNASAINSYMTPPLYAALLALFVGLIPPLKGLLYDKQGFLYPSLTSAVQLCGKAAVPIILVCLGAQLTDISQMHNSLALTKPVTTAVTVRTLLLPLIVIPIVLLFVNFGSKWSAIAADPVFSVMMIIVGCTPTAINLVQICQVTGAFEEDMLRVLFWSYGVICVPMFTLVVFVALNIVDRFL